MRALVVSDHAISRFRERVDRVAGGAEARLAIQQMAALGRLSPRPRHWMCDSRHEPGTAFIYWHRRPGIALVVRDGCITTVLTRQLTRGAATRRRERNSRLTGLRIELVVQPPLSDWEDAA